MKKLYIIPNTVTVLLETQAHMLFGSDQGGDNINGGGSKGTYTSGQLSRKSGWEDED